MSKRLWSLLISSLAVLFVVGFLLGQYFRSGPEAPVPAAPEIDMPPPASPETSVLAAAERRGRQLQGQVETLELALHAARGTQPPEPQPVAAETTEPGAFPEGLAEQFTPSGFERIIRELVRECDLGVDLAEVDCSEYPCLAWVRSKDLSLTHAFPSRCETWNRAFNTGATVTYHMEGNPFGGRTERYHVWIATPPNPDRDVNQQLIHRGEKRMNARWDAMMGDPSR